LLQFAQNSGLDVLAGAVPNTAGQSQPCSGAVWRGNNTVDRRGITWGGLTLGQPVADATSKTREGDFTSAAHFDALSAHLLEHNSRPDCIGDALQLSRRRQRATCSAAADA
jgi:hypothetical protein